MKFALSILLLIFLSACSLTDDYSESLQELYSSRGISFDKETEFCIILPEVGCSGCISGCEYQISTHKDKFANSQKKNLIVFTAINSMKILRRNMQVDSIGEFNCIIDSVDAYLPEGDNKITPYSSNLRTAGLWKPFRRIPIRILMLFMTGI
ncbi:MAG: hypothetical protein NC336_05900 [Clostridium sp.]|nr:hypothetical protein [Clostridium sp.]